MAGGVDPAEPDPLPRTTLRWVVTGYLCVGAGAVLYASDGPLRADPLSALLRLPLVAYGAAWLGVWAARGRPRPTLPAPIRWVVWRVPWGVRTVLARPLMLGAGRGALAGTAVLLGGGAVVAAGSLALHAGAAGRSFAALSQPWSGRFAVLLLALALVPNACGWAAAYVLGPGFTLGAGSVVRPVGAVAHPDLPAFPLLAALPEEGPGTPLTWLVLLVPVLAGLAVARFAAGPPAIPGVVTGSPTAAGSGAGEGAA
ncbi:cell division protein PerM, partial [Streptomyces sp. URMC 123]|uniref:cell division protein PerM n=1 Tax=Streptomyces sp. URMC 123 TaxID=3423403 RepID=UPI003F1AC73B